MKRQFKASAILLFCLTLVLAACTAPQQRQSDTRERRSTAARRDLSRDEAQGGHTLSRHVGRTDSELRERLQRERNIRAASTYTDVAVAEETVAAAIAGNDQRIRRWEDRTGGHPNLVLDYDAPRSVGRTLPRGASVAEPCSHAVVVLRWSGTQFYVLTSYPEC